MNVYHAFGELEDDVDLLLVGALDPVAVVAHFARNANDAAENGQMSARTLGTCACTCTTATTAAAARCLMLVLMMVMAIARDEVALRQDGVHEREVGVLERLLDLERAVRALADVVERIERVLDAQYGRAIGRGDRCRRRRRR